MLVALLALAPAALALYSPSDDVIQLTASNFDRVVGGADLPVAVEFFAPWCGHCKALAPEYKKFASQTKGVVHAAAIDCDEAVNKQICGRYGIQGFPTIKVFPTKRNSKGGKVPVDYQGPRNAKGLAEFTVSKLESHVSVLKTVDDVHAFVAADNEPTLPAVLVFTSKTSTPATVKALSSEYQGRARVAEVRKSVTGAAEAFDVDSVPAVLLFTAVNADGVRERIPFEGDFKAVPLSTFVKGHAPAKKSSSSSSSSSSKPSAVVSLSDETLAKIQDDNQLWLVEFGGAKCKTCGGDEWEGAARALKGVAQFGKVDCSAHGELCRDTFGVSSAPSKPLVHFFGHGAKTLNKGTVYSGARTAKAINEYAVARLPDLSELVTSLSWDAVVNDGKSDLRVILLSSKDEVPVMWKGLSVEFEGRVRLLFVPGSDTGIAEKMGNPKLPAIFAMLPVPAEEPDGPERMQMVPYNGRIKYAEVAAFVGAIAQAASGPAAEPEASAVGDGKVWEINAQGDYDKYCGDRTGICVLTIVTGDPLNKPDEDRQLEIMGGVAKALISDPFTFVSITLERGPAMPDFFRVSAYPAVIAMNPRRGRYANFVGAYDQAALVEFLRGVIVGKVRTAPMGDVPAVVPAPQAAHEDQEAGDCGGGDGEEELCTAPPKDEL